MGIGKRRSFYRHASNSTQSSASGVGCDLSDYVRRRRRFSAARSAWKPADSRDPFLRRHEHFSAPAKHLPCGGEQGRRLLRLAEHARDSSPRWLVEWTSSISGGGPPVDGSFSTEWKYRARSEQVSTRARAALLFARSEAAGATSVAPPQPIRSKTRFQARGGSAACSIFANASRGVGRKRSPPHHDRRYRNATFPITPTKSTARSHSHLAASTLRPSPCQPSATPDRRGARRRSSTRRSRVVASDGYEQAVPAAAVGSSEIYKPTFGSEAWSRPSSGQDFFASRTVVVVNLLVTGATGASPFIDGILAVDKRGQMIRGSEGARLNNNLISLTPESPTAPARSALSS